VSVNKTAHRQFRCFSHQHSSSSIRIPSLVFLFKKQMEKVCNLCISWMLHMPTHISSSSLFLLFFHFPKCNFGVKCDTVLFWLSGSICRVVCRAMLRKNASVLFWIAPHPPSFPISIIIIITLLAAENVVH